MKSRFNEATISVFTESFGVSRNKPRYFNPKKLASKIFSFFRE